MTGVLGTYRGQPVWLEADEKNVTTKVMQSSLGVEPHLVEDTFDIRWLNGSFANWLRRRGVEVPRV